MQACWCYRQPSQLHTRDLLQACWRCAVHMSKHEVLYLQEQFSHPKAFEGERFWTCICFVVVRSTAACMRIKTLGSEPPIKDSSRPEAFAGERAKQGQRSPDSGFASYLSHPAITGPPPILSFG